MVVNICVESVGYPANKNDYIHLIGLCISYNYYDTLKFMLPVNHMHFEKLYIITHEDDLVTIEFCKNYDNVEVIKGDYTEAVKTWTEPIQILHIDGDHSYEGCKRDFDNWSPLVVFGGIILMHDVKSQSWIGSVGKVFDETEGWYKGHFNESEGLGILVKNVEILKDIKSNFESFDPHGNI